MDSLEVLSLGRNNIKKIEGLDGVADTLKELWISYNSIEKLAGIEKLKCLEVLFMCVQILPMHARRRKTRVAPWRLSRESRRHNPAGKAAAGRHSAYWVGRGAYVHIRNFPSR